MRYQEFKLSEYTDLNSEKKAIIAKIRASSAEDPEQAKILDKIWKILNTGQISQNIDNAFNASIDDETEFSGGELATVKKEVAQIVASVETDYGTLSKFVARLGTGGVVSINALKKPAATFLEVFGDQSAILAFNALARYGVGKKQKGPGEYALACLSNQIKLAAGEGDLEITGMGKVELKTAMSKSGGRIGYGGGSQKNKISVLELYRERIPTIMQTVAKNAKGGSLGFPGFLNALNIDLPIAGGGSNPEATSSQTQWDRELLVESLLSMDMDKFSKPVAKFIATNEDVTACQNEYLKANFNWYKDRDQFDALLLMSVGKQKTICITTAEGLVKARPQLASLSISIIPTQAGAGREQWAQLTPL